MPLEPVTLSQLAGPLGGTIAISWAAGAASGYIFAMKTVKEKLVFMQAQLKISDQVCAFHLKP